MKYKKISSKYESSTLFRVPGCGALLKFIAFFGCLASLASSSDTDTDVKGGNPLESSLNLLNNIPFIHVKDSPSIAAGMSTAEASRVQLLTIKDPAEELEPIPAHCISAVAIARSLADLAPPLTDFNRHEHAPPIEEPADALSGYFGNRLCSDAHTFVTYNKQQLTPGTPLAIVFNGSKGVERIAHAGMAVYNEGELTMLGLTQLGTGATSADFLTEFYSNTTVQWGKSPCTLKVCTEGIVHVDPKIEKKSAKSKPAKNPKTNKGHNTALKKEKKTPKSTSRQKKQKEPAPKQYAPPRKSTPLSGKRTDL